MMTELLAHQKQAVKKLKKIKIGALYMEMGTGKTLTALKLIDMRLKVGKVDTVLWLCPCSVKTTIEEEIKKHCPEMLDIIKIDGIESVSQSTNTYLDLMQWAKENRFFLVVDESNLVKNPRAKRSIRIYQLSTYAKYKLILNGTPMSRNVSDLYAQWKILDWRVLGYKSYYTFESQHIEYDDQRPGLVKNIIGEQEIVDKISPYTFQAKKEECLDLPKKSYSTEYYRLTHNQMWHYQDVKDKFLLEVDELVPETIYRLFTACQHVVRGMRIISNSYERMRTKPFFQDPEDNPRIDALYNAILRMSGKKIIWCRYTDEIKLITKLLNESDGENAAVMITGEMNPKEREESIKRFKNDSQYLVANKACAGYGLNLQFCDYMIYFTNDWDLATRLQSEDRVHRIGQKNNVHIVDICAKDTIDEKIIDCLYGKEGMLESLKDKINKKNLSDWLGGSKHGEKVYRENSV